MREKKMKLAVDNAKRLAYTICNQWGEEPRKGRRQMKAVTQIKRQLMAKYGWTAIRRDRQGNWWVRGSAMMETGWRRRWEVKPMWADAEIEQMIVDGVIRG